MKGLAGLAIAAVLAFAPVAHADIKALEEGAKKEGELTWYVAHYTSEGAEDLGRGFTEMYGVKVNVVRTTAQVAYQRLLQDLKNNQTICDVFSSTDVGHYVRLATEGRFEKYVPETENKILPTFRNFDPAGFYHTTSAGLVVLTYNSTKVKAEEAPKKWQDLLDIKWKGKVSTGHPGFSGYVGTWVLTMKNLYGWSYFDNLEKNKPQIGRSINDTVTALNAGERQVAAGADGSTLFSASRGNPLAVSYPTDGSVLIIAPSAIMKGTKHSNAARLFMEYLYSIEAAKINAKHFAIPLRPEVPSPPGAKPISEIKTIRPTVADIDKGIPEVIEQWRDTFGN
ncbi:iron(III) transport system substrate-binding protein [Rhodospirillales bacterium URHD0017]|nr:iron(III) transport system substrate-binding protein [Rhodospirillales bacterium URHD0017]